MVSWRSVFILCLGALLWCANAQARDRWDQPALGNSASGQPEVLFTFDDGPHEKHTPPILAALKKHRIQAIFFMTGWRLVDKGKFIATRVAIAKQVLAEGHMIGNHTLRHAHLCSGGRKRAEQEIDSNAKLLAGLAQMEVPFFRAPYGSRCKVLDEILAARGISHLHWDLDAHEYLTHDAAATRRYLTNRLAKLEGRAVVLMHDTQAVTATVFPEVLDWLAEENARRRAIGAPVIKVLSYADVVSSRLPKALRTLSENWLSSLAKPSRIVQHLLAPLAPL